MITKFISHEYSPSSFAESAAKTDVPHQRVSPSTSALRRTFAAVTAFLFAALILMGVTGTGVANAVESGPGHGVGQRDLLLDGDETARAASGDVWAAYSYCVDGGIIAQYGLTWSVIGGGAGTALAAASFGVSIPVATGVGGFSGTLAASISCTGMVIDAAKKAQSQGKWAGLTFAAPGGGWSWTY